MPSEFHIPSNQEAMMRRYPVAAYFALTFSISWTAALGVAALHPPPDSVKDDRHPDVSGHASRSKFCWHSIDQDQAVCTASELA
jgi:hypothetical protein